MPLLDLRERIEKEMLENPALEMKEKTRDEDQNIESIEDSFADPEESSFFADSSDAGISTGQSPTSSNIDLKRNFLEGHD